MGVNNKSAFANTSVYSEHARLAEYKTKITTEAFYAWYNFAQQEGLIPPELEYSKITQNEKLVIAAFMAGTKCGDKIDAIKKMVHERFMAQKTRELQQMMDAI